MNPTTILAYARQFDPIACWASDDSDENCLLIEARSAAHLLARYPAAYEDPNPPGDSLTRIIFPQL